MPASPSPLRTAVDVRHALSPVPPGGPDLPGLAFDTAPVALAVVSLDGRWVEVNRALCDFLGYRADQLLGFSYREVTHPDDVESDERAAAELMSAGDRGPAIEKRFRHADGHLVWARVTATLVRDADGRPVCVVVAAEDIAEHRHRHAELSRLVLHDPLTGVRNRVRLDADVERVLRTRDRDGGVVAVLYVDVDDFKGINDAYGHEAGDRALVALSARLRDAVREEDTVARVGGDEFVLVAHLSSAEQAGQLRDRVEQVSARPLALAEGTRPVRVSVGMVVVDAVGTSAARALAAADRAMYEAKRARKELGAR